MKRLVILAAAAALTTMAAGTAEAGKPTGKRNNYASQSASQYNGSPYQSSAKLKPMQSQSYQGQWSGQQSQPSYPKLKPTQAVQQTGLSRVPKFGFDSTFGWRGDWLGEHVTHVHFGGPASRLGLEPGDAIIGVNGRELRTANCWYNAIDRAAAQDGWVTLKIVDGRSGRLAYRTANLFQLDGR